MTDPIEGDELIQFTEPKKGTYKKLIVRDGRLVGGILMGDISKAAYLMQAFHRNAPLPEERLSLLFDFGAPSQKITIDEMPADMQICTCNGVTKAALGACVAEGNRTTKGAMDATRAGKGCGSCKNLVAEVVLWFCGGEVEEDPSIHYYVPGVPLTKPQLIAAAREQGLKSVSSVFKALTGGLEGAASKPALMQFYRENAKWRERTYDFVARIGIERIRAVIVEDCEGLGAALDAAMQASVDAAYDPWKEATAPKTVNQFASAISAAEA